MTNDLLNVDEVNVSEVVRTIIDAQAKLSLGVKKKKDTDGDTISVVADASITTNNNIENLGNIKVADIANNVIASMTAKLHKAKQAADTDLPQTEEPAKKDKKKDKKKKKDKSETGEAIDTEVIASLNSDTPAAKVQELEEMKEAASENKKKKDKKKDKKKKKDKSEKKDKKKNKDKSEKKDKKKNKDKSEKKKQQEKEDKLLAKMDKKAIKKLRLQEAHDAASAGDLSGSDFVFQINKK